MSSNRPEFNQLNIVSADPEASLEFYRQLGIDIPEKSVWRTRTGTHHASAKATAGEGAPDFDIDSIVFAQNWNKGWIGHSDIGGRVVVGFQVQSRPRVDELYGKLMEAGHVGLQAPNDAFWGARYAIVEDPDRIAIGLMSPVSEELKSQPPEV